MKRKHDWNPDYMPHPSETIKEECFYQLLGKDWAKEIETEGIKPEKAYLLSALLHIPESVLLNLQKNYDEWFSTHQLAQRKKTINMLQYRAKI